MIVQGPPVTVRHEFVTSSEQDVEQAVAYFREDMGLNLHHKHWHFAYDTYFNISQDKDRSGEVFFYLHEQVIAR